MSSNLRHWHEQAEERAKRSVIRTVPFGHRVGARRHRLDQREGAITFWNRSAATIFGYEKPRRSAAARTCSPRRIDRLPRSAGRRLGTSAITVGQTIELTGAERTAAASRSSCPCRPDGGRHLRDSGRPRRHRTKAPKRSSASAKPSCGRRRRWKPSGCSPAASPTTSTTC